MKRLLPIILTAILASAVTIGFYEWKYGEESETVIHYVSEGQPANSKYASLNSPTDVASISFSEAAQKSIGSVVHIKSLTVYTEKKYNIYQYRDPFLQLFGDSHGRHYYYGEPYEQQKVRQSSGSGVIISEDGYIVTNNHVIRNASEVEVVLNDNRSFKAEVKGVDPTTDIALLKIDAEDLPAISFSDSDEVEIGDWVLAVGNPFNLSSTVTAGIVSAKARNINILSNEFAIESFIQTDAAVNPGNSGGALVNTKGDLIGINTAIATPTGTFAGYSFAVPANIVSKVVNDLIEYGVVQRAYLGVRAVEIDNELADKLGIDFTEGIYVESVVNKSAAFEAGIQEGDIILEIDDKKIKQTSELLEKLGSQRPGDKIKLTIYRNGTTKELTAKLKNEQGKTGIIRKDANELSTFLGANFEPLSKKECQKLRINCGLRVKNIKEQGKIKESTGIKEGFIITRVNKQPVATKEDLEQIIKQAQRGVIIEGIYPGYYGRYYYSFGL